MIRSDQEILEEPCVVLLVRLEEAQALYGEACAWLDQQGSRWAYEGSRTTDSRGIVDLDGPRTHSRSRWAIVDPNVALAFKMRFG